MGYKASLKLLKTEYYECGAFLPTEPTTVISCSTVVGDQTQAHEQLAEAAQFFSPPPKPIAGLLQMGWRSAKTKPAQTEVLMRPSI